MEIEEATVVEELVYGYRHVMTDAHHGTESVGAQTHVRVLAHVFEALSLLLHGIVGAAQAVNLYLTALYLRSLTGSLALDKHSRGTYAGTCGDLLQHILVELGGIDNYLNVLYGRAVVQCYEINSLAAAVRTHPSLHIDNRSEVGAFENVDYLCSTYCLHIIYML